MQTCMINHRCIVCNKKIRMFTVAKDWETRPMHKKCWLADMERKTFIRMMEDYEKTKEHVEKVMKEINDDLLAPIKD